MVVRKTLGQERTQRLVLPGLDVTRRPVIEQAHPKQVRGGVLDSDGFSQAVSWPDKEARFQFVIQRLAGRKVGRRTRLGHNLARRPLHRRAAHENRRCPAVIPDGHVLVIRQEGILRPEEPAHIRGVVDRGIEVGVIADQRRLEHRSPGHRVKMRLQGPLVIGSLGMIGTKTDR